MLSFFFKKKKQKMALTYNRCNECFRYAIFNIAILISINDSKSSHQHF